jgi:hypothetical protein
VPGATVRVERLVADQTVTTDVVTAVDGTWAVQAVQGGRYRIRAWRTPDLATPKSDVLFLGATEQRRLGLRLDEYIGVTTVASVNPNPPPVDEPTGLAVLVADRAVDQNGVVRATPRAFARIDLFSTGAWRLRSQSAAFTDAGGRAQWVVECEDAGPQPLDVVVDQRAFRLAVPACADASTSTTLGSGTRPGGGPTSTKPTRRRPPSSTSTTPPP